LKRKRIQVAVIIPRRALLEYVSMRRMNKNDIPKYT
jgi:hypothetical protein